jgi:hypothetical protein
MKLVFINKAGKLHNGKYLYELQFCEDDGDAFFRGEQDHDWDQKPATSRPQALSRADAISYFLTDKDLSLTRDSHVFSLEDAKEQIVALAYSEEKIFGTKLKIFYGQDYEEIKDVLYEKNIKLIEKENIFA